MKDRMPQMLRRAQRYTSLDGIAAEKDTVAWYWRVIAGIASWLLVGGFLMLPATFDTSDDFKFSKTVLTILSITFAAAGVCLTAVLLLVVRNWQFQADAILFPAFSSCLVGLLTALYSFLVHRRYTWNLAGILTTAFSAGLTITYGVLLFITQRRVAACRGLAKPQHIPLRSHTSYEDARTIYEPSIQSTVPPMPQSPPAPTEPLPDNRTREQSFYNNYLSNMYPMLRTDSRAAPRTPAPPTAGPQTPNTPWDAQSVVSERPPAPPINRPPVEASMLTQEELTRQQMLMLLLNRPEPERPVDPAGHPLQPETSYRIDWNGGETQTPIVGPGETLNTPHRQIPSTPIISPPSATSRSGGIDQITPSRPQHTHTRSTSSQKALEALTGGRVHIPHGVPPPSYEQHWDGVMRTAADIPQDRLHPAFRESRFMRTGGAREERRREIERGSTPTHEQE
ncbi:hypothetical protein BDZ85DRAFT_263977 [Elsinoe ampelina]|uniref:Uncharacterized protein n=1 Tax=Elsinoe ampelina TaxID=302913 RepID=A0A6A6GA86_9PEZI|nr:hypothetical protein BDZ85DRAFT_263977 [Elsinoe ampelina]